MVGAILALAVPPITAVYILLVLLILDESQTYVQYLLVVPVAYLLGSIPWGVMVTNIVRGVDVRQYGSGRTGMSNVLRLAGMKVAIPVLLLDMSKGALAVLFAKFIPGSSEAVVVVAAIVVIVGHNWSLFLRFRGGRGTATGAGGILVITWPLGPLAFAAGAVVFPLVTLWSRYISLGSLSAVVAIVLVLLIGYLGGNLSLAYLLYGIIGGAIIVWGHRDNIRRLIQGKERKVGQLAEGMEHRA